MAPARVSEHDFIKDVTAGLTDAQLMAKYKFSHRRLYAQIDKLVSQGKLDPAALLGDDDSACLSFSAGSDPFSSDSSSHSAVSSEDGEQSAEEDEPSPKLGETETTLLFLDTLLGSVGKKRKPKRQAPRDEEQLQEREFTEEGILEDTIIWESSSVVLEGEDVQPSTRTASSQKRSPADGASASHGTRDTKRSSARARKARASGSERTGASQGNEGSSPRRVSEDDTIRISYDAEEFEVHGLTAETGPHDPSAMEKADTSELLSDLIDSQFGGGSEPEPPEDDHAPGPQLFDDHDATVKIDYGEEGFNLEGLDRTGPEKSALRRDKTAELVSELIDAKFGEPAESKPEEADQPAEPQLFDDYEATVRVDYGEDGFDLQGLDITEPDDSALRPTKTEELVSSLIDSKFNELEDSPPTAPEPRLPEGYEPTEKVDYSLEDLAGAASDEALREEENSALEPVNTGRLVADLVDLKFDSTPPPEEHKARSEPVVDKHQPAHLDDEPAGTELPPPPEPEPEERVPAPEQPESLEDAQAARGVPKLVVDDEEKVTVTYEPPDDEEPPGDEPAEEDRQAPEADHHPAREGRDQAPPPQPAPPTPVYSPPDTTDAAREPEPPESYPTGQAVPPQDQTPATSDSGGSFVFTDDENVYVLTGAPGKGGSPASQSPRSAEADSVEIGGELIHKADGEKREEKEEPRPGWAARVPRSWLGVLPWAAALTLVIVGMALFSGLFAPSQQNVTTRPQPPSLPPHTGEAHPKGTHKESQLASHRPSHEETGSAAPSQKTTSEPDKPVRVARPPSAAPPSPAETPPTAKPTTRPPDRQPAGVRVASTRPGPPARPRPAPAPARPPTQAEASAITVQPNTRAEGEQLLPAVRSGDLEQAGALLTRGSDPNIVGTDGTNPLLLAAASGNEPLVQRLLDAGAAVDQADTEGNTPLMMAAANGHPGLVRLLLLSGANPHAKNRNGRTALTWAYAPAPALFHDVGALREVVTLLRSHDRGSRQ